MEGWVQRVPADEILPKKESTSFSGKEVNKRHKQQDKIGARIAGKVKEISRARVIIIELLIIIISHVSAKG